MLTPIENLIEAFEYNMDYPDTYWAEYLGGKPKANSILNSILKSREELDEYDIIQLVNTYDIGIDPYSMTPQGYIEEFIRELKKELKNEYSHQEE